MSFLSQLYSKIALPNEHGTKKEAIIASFLYTILAVGVTAIVIWGAYFGGITALVLRSMFYSMVAMAGLFAVSLETRFVPTRVIFYILGIIALVPGIYLWHSYFDIVMRGALSTQVDEWMFIALVIITLILVRKTLGWALLILSVTALLYAYFGYVIPGKYGHGGYDLARLASTLFLSTEGFYGAPMGVAVEYIFLFALLGTLLMQIGTGEVFVDVARGVTGRIQGGPGLSAAVSSTLVGTINGSAVANVVTTGTFTIPLMKRVGYSAKLAGAIEAAASSAGQILPPVMGAAAFLMAEIIGVPYSTIALAALVPGLLYVLALLVAVRLEAGKLDLARDTTGGVGFLIETLKTRGYLLLPLIGIIVLLFMGMTPTRAAVYCIGFALLISPWRKETRIGLTGLLVVCRNTLFATLPIVAAVAAAGIVIGVLNLTGMGLMLSSLIVEVGAGNIWAILLLTALASFVLGMGLPTSAAYLLLAVLVAPALTQLGLPAISAHMFIFYFGLVSAITPPVALAAYAAASISGADANETAVESIRLGFVKLLVPFLFVTMPGILMIGTPLQIVLGIVFAAFAVISITVAFAGWLVRPISWLERGALVVGTALVCWPTPVDATDAVTLGARLAGLAIIGLSIFRMVTAAPRPTIEVQPN
ncbi:TRAP transporter fused permease subunit [Pelagibacterium flavum]|uniref:TRAP transporter fused permease subunit n=1 Tax=Pelagibacterium flavum TaxID=2984530 RepID=A0ABY6IN33_9HYPH|nr:TRAP transporter fused permease subunit [Pelagibacterium sp. YIM 151497]UYQ72006.1 TRAP transporter fused permease subunit [Pelagibacterium sp. YIM 151497]